MYAHVIKIILLWHFHKAVMAEIGATNVELSTSPNNITYVTKLHIGIYYESLCSDSTDFLINQFGPAYSIFKKYIDVAFIPFGKSESENNGSVFFCQHGPAECTGNRLQSCVLDALGDDQDAKVSFVTCQMKWDSEYTGQKCISMLNISYPNIMECSRGSKGIELQLEAEQNTHLIAKPYPQFIPTIVYNKEFNRLKQWRSLREFRKLVCELLAPALKTSEELSRSCINAR